jgi:transcription antitermination factor NusG
MNPKLYWFVMYTKPKYELKVHNQLIEMGIESYCPTVKTMRQWSDRKKKVTVPLFKSYCFVRIMKKNILLPLKANGAIRILYFEHEPAIVRDYEIETIKLFCNAEYPIESADILIPKGKKLIISSGPFKGLECECIKQSGKHKIIVRIETVQQVLMVTVPKAMVTAC